jgi:hypothetical protein
MQPLYELGRVHHAEALRAARARHRSTPAACHHRVLGLPIGPACAPRLSASAC